MTLPWFVALWHQAGTEYLEVFFVHNHLQRFLPGVFAGKISGSTSGHHNPFYYYVTNFPGAFLPWSILLMPVLFHAFSKSVHSTVATGIGLPKKGLLFVKCWFLAGIIFLSAASTKRILYLMPVFAPIATLTALYIDSTLTSPRPLDRLGKIFMSMFVLVLFVIGLALTPAYFYLKEPFFSDASQSFLVAILVVSALIIATALAGTVYLKRQNLRRYWISINISIILVLLFTVTTILPIVDTHKSFVPFCRQITASLPANQLLHAYQPDETLRGGLPFYTGHYVIETEELASVLKILQEEKPFYIVIRDKKGETEKELLNAGKLTVLVKQMMGADRALVLLSNRPANGAITINDTFKKN
jgi:4-amino-4-deoxy-L-arabinose transferase-like glycosyltransferase